MQLEFPGSTAAWLLFGAPRAEYLWRGKSPYGGTNSSACVNREGAVPFQLHRSV